MLCNPFICGDNAATAGDGLLFDEFDLDHQPNYAHVQMVGAKLFFGEDDPGPGVPVQLGIDHDVLFATDQNNNRLEGNALVNIVIEMKYQNGAVWDRFQLRIFGFNANTIQFIGGAHEPVPTYLIKSRRLDKEGGLFSENLRSPPFNFFVCNNDVLPIDPTWSAAPHDAMVFRGDRYHPTQKRVYGLNENPPDSSWSFLACAGGAAAKMHLYRHTYAGAFQRYVPDSAPYMTTIDERTILMKTITADYCGTGSPAFTKNGTPLRFDVNASFSMPQVDLTLGPAPSPGTNGLLSYEAVWNVYGALCLDNPRSPDWTHETVEKACGGQPIQTCTSMVKSLPSNWRTFGYTVTANPMP